MPGYRQHGEEAVGFMHQRLVPHGASEAPRGWLPRDGNLAPEQLVELTVLDRKLEGIGVTPEDRRRVTALAQKTMSDARSVPTSVRPLAPDLAGLASELDGLARREGAPADLYIHQTRLQNSERLLSAAMSDGFAAGEVQSVLESLERFRSDSECVVWLRSQGYDFGRVYTLERAFRLAAVSSLQSWKSAGELGQELARLVESVAKHAAGSQEALALKLGPGRGLASNP